MNPNAELAEQALPIVLFQAAVPAGGAGAALPYVSLKGYSRVTFLILQENATTVTGSAITLSQAQAVAGTGVKALSFDHAQRSLDTATDPRLARFDVASDTFTTDATDSKNSVYAIDVKRDQLDVENGFDCVRPNLANAVAATCTVVALCWPAIDSGADINALVD